MADDVAAMKAEIERLKGENESLKGKIVMKVAPKGGMSLYGFGRWPVTLYKEQWLAILDMADKIRAFLEEHDKELKAKK